ncbi:AIPR family protein [Vibrio spartinae]|uniref:AIPR protein n=1 Tax=Vibrio spartinae TaxID=1918945 RepID=A0ABX6QWH8_9VIBR|nr:AIPR family protein [Vibrio spartinae]QMV13593.1 AIPR protein [Vibrio spartinae]
MKKLKFELTCEDYRVLRLPNENDEKSKLGTLFVEVSQLPDELRYWTDVNPRNPKLTRADKLSGQVARSIVKTLEEDPSKFALKNLGIYLLVDDVVSKRVSGDKHELEITLSDPEQHGIVNGGHTFQAIRQVVENELYLGGAFVRLHLYQNINRDLIVDLAEGLNRNLQVTDTSLQNLQNKFDTIKQAMSGHKGEDQIAYSDGESGSVDILEVIHLMSLLNISQYPKSDKHPNDIFGSKQKVLKRYGEDIDSENSAFKILIPHVHEILVLSEEIQRECAKFTSLYKIKNTDNKNRVGSEEHKREAIFFTGQIGGFIPQGWLYPMLAAFRANISPQEWSNGKLKWLVDPKVLLKDVIQEMTDKITNIHKENKNKPAEVGRKPTSYDLCYATVFMRLAIQGKLELN